MSDPEVEYLKDMVDVLKSSIDGLYEALIPLARDLDELIQLRHPPPSNAELHNTVHKMAEKLEQLDRKKQVEVAIVDKRQQ